MSAILGSSLPMEELDYDDAMGVLVGWEGRSVLVVAFVEPGVSLRPFAGTLNVEDDGRGVKVAIAVPGRAPIRIAFAPAVFHEAEWVPGMEDRGLSIETGATRVDIFLDD